MFTLTVKDICTGRTRTCRCRSIRSRPSTATRPALEPGCSGRREFVMKDSYSFDLDDAGLQISYDAASRRLHQAVRPSRVAVRDRVGDVGRHGRLGLGGVPGADRRRRGHVHPLHVVRLRGQRRSGPHTRSRRDPVRRAARRRSCTTHAEDADDRHPGRLRQRRPGTASSRSRLDRSRHAEERRRQPEASRRHHRAAGDRAAEGLATST